MSGWVVLSNTSWPNAHGNYWVRHKRLGSSVVMLDKTHMFFHGSSLRTTSRYDYDIGQWEVYDERINEPAEVVNQYMGFI